MAIIILSIGVSLDGFIDHDKMIADDEAIQYATEILNDADAMLFGRVTYQLMEAYWPTAPQNPSATEAEVAFANRINSIPKMVCSHTLKQVSWDHTILIDGDVVDAVTKLKQESDGRILLGGTMLANTLLQHDLVDEFELRINPFLMGQGKRLFRTEFTKTTLKLVDTHILHSGIVSVRYAKDNAS